MCFLIQKINGKHRGYYSESRDDILANIKGLVVDQEGVVWNLSRMKENKMEGITVIELNNMLAKVEESLRDSIQEVLDSADIRDIHIDFEKIYDERGKIQRIIPTIKASI